VINSDQRALLLRITGDLLNLKYALLNIT